MTTGSSDSDALTELRRAVLEPGITVAPCDLARLFTVTHVVVEAERPESFESYPDLAVRMRGALGNALHAMGPPPPVRKGAKPVARAWDVLMEPFAPAITKPMTVHTDVVGNCIRIQVNLAGLASYWRHDVTSALIAACEMGVKLSNEGRFLTPLRVTSASNGTTAGFEPPDFPVNEVRLRFDSPLRLRSQTSTRISAPSLLISMANRARTLAPWRFLTLDEDWDSLHRAAWHVEGDDSGLLPYRWDRGSQRARARIPVLGFIGTMVMRGPLERFVPYLQICEAMNAGSHAALGLGRFMMSQLPR